MVEHLCWIIEFYVDARGISPVLQFVESLSERDQTKVARVLALLREFGPLLGMPHARPVGNLWELRAGPGRIFYFACTGRRFVLLHAYRKKGQKTPRREIETAQRRWADFMEGER